MKYFIVMASVLFLVACDVRATSKQQDAMKYLSKNCTGKIDSVLQEEPSGSKMLIIVCSPNNNNNNRNES